MCIFSPQPGAVVNKILDSLPRLCETLHMQTIRVFNLDNHPTAPYASFVDLQGDFKTYPEIERLASRIQAVGFKYDVYAYESTQPEEHNGQTYPPGTRFILDAHSRCRALALCESQGWTIPEIPYTRIYAESLDQAKQELLFLNSRYGVIQPDSDFLSEILSTTPEDILESLALPELEEMDTREMVELLPDADTEPDEPTDHESATDRNYPLAVVLNRAQFEQWQAFKQRLGVKTDTQAVLKILEG
jgi:hypothetical protein